MKKIEIYTKSWCPYCQGAKALLDSKGLQYQEHDVAFNSNRLQEMIERSQRRTVPQIFINDLHIGGYDDLVKLNRNGKLDEILNTTKRNAA